MKLRILENSLRIRLSADEVQTVLAERRIESRTCFGTDQALTCTLEISPHADAPSVSFSDGKLRIDLTESQAGVWAEDVNTGIHQTLETPEGPLDLLIEKDRRP